MSLSKGKVLLYFKTSQFSISEISDENWTENLRHEVSYLISQHWHCYYRARRGSVRRYICNDDLEVFQPQSR